MDVILAALAIAAATPVASEAPTPETKFVASVLDDWHMAAAQANESRYFGHLAANAIFLGTDATERWNKEEFRRFAHPYFEKGKAWSFRPKDRHIFVSADGKTAWFDEALSTPNLGPARGSGVLVMEGSEWKIAQYNLSVPIPNDIFKEVKRMIEQHSGAKKEPGR
jgi:hypothetical protein